MKFRCPYCKHIIQNTEPPSLCPKCRKSMTIPDHLRTRTLRQRRNDREKIQAAADRERQRIFTPNFLFGKKSSGLLIAAGLLVFAGAGLIYKASQNKQPDSEFHRIQRAEKELTALRMALECFKRDCGRYPTATEGLNALFDDPGAPGWAGSYINKIKPDQWRMPYQYSLENNTVTLYSFGPDHTDGTDDDLYAELPADPAADLEEITVDETGENNPGNTPQTHEVNLNPNP